MWWQKGLWQHAAFRRLWAGQAVSLLGSQATFLAVPFVAAVSLGATPLQMGILGALGGLPALALGLPIGAWVDRSRRRPLLILADFGRAALLLTVPVAYLLDILRIEVLYTCVLLVGCLSLLFEVAAQSYVPTIVARESLVEANSKLETSRSAAEIVGPGLAGGLIQAIGAPLTLLADACSYLVSGLLIMRITTPESTADTPETSLPLRHAVVEGVRWVLGHRLLRPLVGASALFAFANSVIEAVGLLYLARTLALPPAVLGIIFALGGAGFLLGSLAAERITRLFGPSPTMIGALALVAAADLLVPLASGSTLVVAALLIVAQFSFGCGLVVFNINAVSLRQGVTPQSLLGRVNASVRLLVQGLTPLGAIGGGLLGGWLGLRQTLFLAVGVELVAVLWLLLSPLREQRAPLGADEDAEVALLPPSSSG